MWSIINILNIYEFLFSSAEIGFHSFNPKSRLLSSNPESVKIANIITTNT